MKTPNHLHPCVLGTQVSGSARRASARDLGSASDATGDPAAYSVMPYNGRPSYLARFTQPHAVRAILYILYALSILALAARQTTESASSTPDELMLKQQSQFSAGLRRKGVWLAPARVQPANSHTRLWVPTARSTPPVAAKHGQARAQQAPAIRVIRPQATQRVAPPAAVPVNPIAVAQPSTQPATTQAAEATAITAITAALSGQSAPPSGLLAEDGAPLRKVITVSALKLPPASEPLPAWMRGSVLPIEGVTAAPLPSASAGRTTGGKAGGERLAQNPSAPPLRQPTRPVTNSDRLPNQLEVAVGTFVVLITTSDLETVAVAEPGVADVAVVNSRALLINGKSQGVTSVVIVDRAKIRQYQVRVAAAPGARPHDVTAAIGLQNVIVRPLRDTLVLEGDVNSDEESRHAVEIATIFSPKVVNQLRVRDGLLLDNAQNHAMAAQIQEAINLPGITVRVIGETILLEGKVDSAMQRQRAEALAGALTRNKKVLVFFETPMLTVDQVRESLGLAPGATSANDAPAVAVRQVGDQIILEGIVPAQAQIDGAMAIAARSGLQVISRLQLPAAISAETTFLNMVNASIGRPGVTVRGTAKRLILEGTVPDTNAAVAAEQIARSYAAEVDNLLITPSPTLVNVELSFVEVNRNNLKSLGVTFPNLMDSSGGTNLGAIGVGAGNPTTLGATFQARLRAEISTGNARLLSNPRTTVLSGRTATFQVGGQVPIPMTSLAANGSSVTSITFKDFGILVDVIPNATADGVVTMRVRTEVSDVDFDNLGVNIQGGRVPGFTRRSSVTEVTVRPNGTVALGGLIQNNVTTAISRIPVLSRIPILGALFTSKRFQRNETELVIFVTPTVLPNPLAPGVTAPAGVVAVGNTTNVGTVTGNPGIASFNSGDAFSPGGGGATP